MNDFPTLVRFTSGWEPDGIGADGMPLYKENIIIRLDRPPLLSITRVATDEDFNEHPGPFELFQKEQASRKQSYSEGYPLVLWPAVNEAEFKMLADRDISTVEQLAKLHTKNNQNLPPEIRDLAARAQELVKLQGGAAKYEELLRERDGRIEALTEALKDAQTTVASQKSIIDTLKMRAAG